MSSNEKSSNENGRIVRGKASPFAAIPAQTMNDSRMTTNAAAVLHYMIWRAGIQDWVFCVADIVEHFNVGKKGVAVRSAINELIAFGYVERQQLRDEGGRMIGTRYIVNDISESAPQFSRPFKSAAADSEITRAAPLPQPVKPQPAPVTAAPIAKPAKKPSATATDTVSAVVSEQQKTPRQTAAEARQKRQDMHHRVLEAWNATRGAMPEMDARPTDGRLIADQTLAMLIESLVRDKGGEQHAIDTLRDASKQWNAELTKEPGGWLSRNANIERVFRTAHAAARSWNNAQRGHRSAPTDADAGAAQMPWM